jgi:hypothetical protein
MSKDVVTNIDIYWVYVAAWQPINRMILIYNNSGYICSSYRPIFDSRTSWSSIAFAEVVDQSVATQWLYISSIDGMIRTAILSLHIWIDHLILILSIIMIYTSSIVSSNLYLMILFVKKKKFLRIFLINSLYYLHQKEWHTQFRIIRNNCQTHSILFPKQM